MIQPDEIRRKAENQYAACVRAGLTGDASFFPRLIPAALKPDRDHAQAGREISLLRAGAKERLGYGYSVIWEERNSPHFGRNQFPVRIEFETRDDLLRTIGRAREFERMMAAATAIRAGQPGLADWVLAHAAILPEFADEVPGLLAVVDAFLQRPQPGCFARELPVAVDTKFIERHERTLRQWLDLLLPPHTIRADEAHFARRYGLRYAEQHLHLRCLDPAVQRELGCPCEVLGVPLHTLATWKVPAVTVLIVENQVNLLTLPPIPRAIALGGLGHGVVLLRYLSWLRPLRVIYWGDLDLEGLTILSSLRAFLPQAESLLMDAATLATWRHLAVPGTARLLTPPPHLHPAEHAAFLACAAANLRLEQERLPPPAVLAALALAGLRVETGNGHQSAP